MAENSFRRRLTKVVLRLCLGLLLTAGTVMFLGAKLQLEASRDQALLAIARVELASALDGPGGKPHVHDEPPTTLALLSGAGYEKYALILDARGAVVAQTTNLNEQAPLPVNRPELAAVIQEGARFSTITYQGRALRALYYPLQDRHGARYVGICALPMAPLGQALMAFAMIVALTVGLASVLAIPLIHQAAHSLTHPLEVIAQNASAITRNNLSERILDVSEDTELAAVAGALNEMLGRLEHAFSMQQRFVEDASHELRTPLSNLKGTLEVILRRPRTGEEYQAALRVALVETDRITRLATDLLLLSRVDSGHLSMQLIPSDLAGIAAQAVESACPRATAGSIVLSLDASPTYILGDVARLRQVFDNLLDNAIRYAFADTTISVSVWTIKGEGRLSVHNRGPCIPADQLPHLFDRFYRADPSRSRDSGQAGLGLAIVRAIVEAHNGTIFAESDPMMGTTIGCAFPICETTGDKLCH